MAWFYYKDQTRRQYRKGICLRVQSLPLGLKRKFNQFLPKDCFINYVKVEELRPDNQVLLEAWVELANGQFSNGVVASLVLHYVVDENPDWVCESDIGRGLVLPKTKKKE